MQVYAVKKTLGVIKETGENSLKIKGIKSLNWAGFLVTNEATALMLFPALKSYFEIIFWKYKKHTVNESRK
jgi:hypothetical protein